MEKMLTEVCHEVNNYFRREFVSGTFSVAAGNITNLPEGFLQEEQYFLIEGSIFNQGVFLFHAAGSGLKNEQDFSGAIWALGIPQEFLELVAEIDKWVTKYGGTDSAALSPFSSESFGGYSYSKGASGSSDGSADGANWKTVFASRLEKWRRKKGIV